MNTKRVFRTIDDQRVKLTATHLIEIDYNTNVPWAARIEDLMVSTTGRLHSTVIHRMHRDGTEVTRGDITTLGVHFGRALSPSRFYFIGCKAFSMATFYAILRAVSSTKRAKTLAAKAGA